MKNNIVRCKDCIHSKKHVSIIQDNGKIIHLYRFCELKYPDIGFKDDDYCDCGVKMNLDKLIELTEKYPNLSAILKSGHLAAYHFKQGLNINTQEYQELELELLVSKIITKKSNYMRASNEALQYLGEREIDFENIRVIENLYPGIIGMFESGGVTAGHISIVE